LNGSSSKKRSRLLVLKVDHRAMPKEGVEVACEVERQLERRMSANNTEEMFICVPDKHKARN
jgi:hypothetical protein